MSERRAAKTKHQISEKFLDRLSWDDIRIFLVCANTDSFRKAALKLKMSSSTVVRRIERLEAVMSVRLFNRLPDGVEITQEGRSILSSAQNMESALFDVLRKRNLPDETGRGVVSISITEGLGTYWVTPKIVTFHRQHPFMILDLNCAMDSVDVLRMEADMSIQFQRPVSQDLTIVKLGRLHVYPFVSQEYINIFGTPKSVEDLAQHRIVDQVSPQLQKGAWGHHLNLDDVEGIVGLRTNSSSALFYAVERGAGIGALPTYAMALNAPVVPVDIGIHHHMDIWLTFHPDIRKTPRHSLVIDWLKEIFDAEKYPWFRDDFIHPNDLIDISPKDTAQISVEGFFAATPFKK